MTFKLKTILAIAAVAVAGQAAAQVTFYENDNYQGRSFTTQRNVTTFNALDSMTVLHPSS